MAPKTTCECGSCAKCKRRIYMRDWYRRNRDGVCETARKSRRRRAGEVRAYDRARGYRPSPPEKRKARKQVEIALLNGSLTRLPCEVCSDPQTDAHHEDYLQPLTVRWLCKRHHGEAHRRSF